MREYGYILPKTYRTIGWTFLTVASLVFGFSVYLSLTKVTIVITPMADSTNRIFEVELSSEDKEGIFKGVTQKIEISGSKQFDATGETRTPSENVGEVIITNNSNQPQGLVATTRLADPREPGVVILRLRDNVTVNPGQKVRVAVYAENQENFSDKQPQRFIIPGLRESLREQIYAENEAVLSTAGVAVKVVSQGDIDNARLAISQELKQRAQAQFNANLKNEKSSWIVLSNDQVVNFGANKNAEDQSDNFEATATLNFEAVAFDENALAQYIAEMIKKDSNYETRVEAKQLTYKIQQVNENNALLEVQLHVDPILYATDLFDRSQLIGMNRQEIIETFQSIPGVASVKVKFRPWWLKIAPKDIERIKLEVAN